MSKSVTCPITENFNMNNALEAAKTQLQAQGYEVTVCAMGEKAGSITISKDNDGFKKFMGLGIECSVSLTVMNDNSLIANIESTWTNQIIALCVGWFLCWVPIITGIVGCVNQSDLPKKVATVIQAACVNM